MEEIAGEWLAELFGLPAEIVGYVTGGQMANFTGLAAGLHDVLCRAGWDLATGGLWGAPRVRILGRAAVTGRLHRALRFLGVGTQAIVEVDADAPRPDATRGIGRGVEQTSGPAIVSRAQIGNVNSGSIDPVAESVRFAREHGAWVHVDGAVGLWAALVRNCDPARCWGGTRRFMVHPSHKWLNVPYDSWVVFCAHPDAHRAAMGIRAGDPMHSAGGERDALDYGPEHSRRARGFAIYAAIRALGREGIAELVERCSALASRFAERLGAVEGVEVLNEVVLNLRRRRASWQLVWLVTHAQTRPAIERVQHDGTCWMSGTTCRGQAAMRISVSNWSTDEADVDRAVAAILRCAAE